MNTGSHDERQLLNNVGRIAMALERIANVMEDETYGVTSAGIERLKQRELRGRNAQDDLATEAPSE